jgi:hypothetical protein
MPQASFLAFAHCRDLDPKRVLLRHPNAAAEWRPYATPVITIDTIERRINGVDSGVARCHAITCAPRSELQCPVPPISPGGSAVGVTTMVHALARGIDVF